jgi:transmembrane sensor
MEKNNGPDMEILLNKFLSGSLTIAQKRQLFDLIATSENENTFKEILIRYLDEYEDDKTESGSVDFDRIYGNILNEIKQNETGETERYRSISSTKVRRIILYVSAVAAIFIMAFFLGSLFSGFRKMDSSQKAAYITFNEIKAPLGSKSEIKLPDGTLVMLNSGSTIKYRSDFNLCNRDLILTGEAYFKVAKNVNLPLNVKTGKITIKAVGTEFNVKAYDDERIIETTLVEGKVEITESELNRKKKQYLGLLPDQKAIYLKESGSFSLENIEPLDSLEIQPSNTIFENIIISPEIEVDKIVAWTQGKFILRGESLENLCIELQRKYNVNIIFNNEEIKKIRFSGTLLDESLEQVLNAVKLTAPIEFYVEGKTVVMSTDKAKIGDYSKYPE